MKLYSWTPHTKLSAAIPLHFLYFQLLVDLSLFFIHFSSTILIKILVLTLTSDMSGILSPHSPLLDKFRPLSSTASTSGFTEVFRRVTGHGAGGTLLNLKIPQACCHIGVELIFRENWTELPDTRAADKDRVKWM